MIDNRENNIWTVYVHIVPKAITKYDYDKYYVGITSKSVSKRWGKNGSGYRGQLFYNAIQKYKWNNIEHCIITENLTKEEAQDLEIKLINKLNCNVNNGGIYGYNVCNGGNVTTGYSPSNEIKEKILNTNILHSNYIETYQFDLNKNFINKYYSAEKAGKILNLSPNHIRNCIYNKYYSYGNYIWRDKQNVKLVDGTYKPINLIKKPNTKRKIYQFDLNGNFIASYERLNKVLNFNKNFNTRNIYRCLSGRTKMSYGYIWKYEQDIIINGVPKLKDIYNKRKVHKNYVHIYKFDLNGNFIKDYLNCTEASRDNNIDASYLLKVVKNKTKNKNKIIKNFIWVSDDNIIVNNGILTLLNKKGDDNSC